MQLVVNGTMYKAIVYWQPLDYILNAMIVNTVFKQSSVISIRLAWLIGNQWKFLSHICWLAAVSIVSIVKWLRTLSTESQCFKSSKEPWIH